MAYNGVNNGLVPEEINPNNFVFYMMADENKVKDFDINEYVHPKTKKLVEKFLQNLFGSKQRGRLYNKIVNNYVGKKCASRSKLLTDDNKLKSGAILKGTTAHKSIQTERLLNVCTHVQERPPKKAACDVTTSSASGKHVNNELSNSLHNNRGNLLISGKNVPKVNNSWRYANDILEKRKKLHVTKIGVDKNSNSCSLYMNKNLKGKCGSEMRYVNIKCNAKLQHIPINLHSLHSKGDVSKSSSVHVHPRGRDKSYSSTTAIANVCASNSFSYSPVNRNGNNLIRKPQQSYTTNMSATSKRVQLQELKTYSRKCNENNSCYLLSAVGSSMEHKYVINQIGSSADKVHKLYSSNDKSNTCQLLESKLNANRSNNMFSTPLNKMQLDTAKCRQQTTANVTNGASNLLSTANSYNGIKLTNMTYSKVTSSAKSNSSTTENTSVKLLPGQDANAITTVDNKSSPTSTPYTQ